MLLQIFFSLLSVLVARVLWKRCQYDLHKIPSTPGLPFVGHMLGVLSMRGEGEVNRYVGSQWKALGEPNLFKLSFGGKPIIFIRDMACIRDVVMSKTNPFPKAPGIPAMLNGLFGDDPTAKFMTKTAQVTPHVKAIREVYTAGLQSSNMRASMPKLHKVLDKMIEIIELKRQGGPVDFQELCAKMTLDAIGVIALGSNLGGLDGSRNLYQLILDTGHIVRQHMYNPLWTWKHRLLPFLKSVKEQKQTVSGLTAEWSALTREILALDAPPAGEAPIWYALRSVKDPETGKALEFNSLLAEVATVVLAGMDTTGHQLAIILALMASSPHTIDKLIYELEQHGLYGPACKPVTFEDLSELHYLAAIVKEGMRVGHIVCQIVDRETTKDEMILGYRVPKGSLVTLAGNRWLNSSAEWGDPDVFRPERWLKGEDMSQKYYLPFSCGPRDCVGQKMAILELRVAIIRLVQQYCFTPTQPAEELLKDGRNGFVIEAAQGIWLDVSPRPHVS